MTYRNKIQNRNRYMREKGKERIEKREMKAACLTLPEERERMNE
jgi:hypothetical protein